MKLNPNKLFIAAALTFAIAWVICVVTVIMVPAAMLNLAGDMIHLDLSALTWSMNVTGFFTGLIAWSVIAGAIAWLIAVLYNRLASA